MTTLRGRVKSFAALTVAEVQAYPLLAAAEISIRPAADACDGEAPGGAVMSYPYAVGRPARPLPDSPRPAAPEGAQ